MMPYTPGVACKWLVKLISMAHSRKEVGTVLLQNNIIVFLINMINLAFQANIKLNPYKPKTQTFPAVGKPPIYAAPAVQLGNDKTANGNARR
jgi:hypothetical protein